MASHVKEIPQTVAFDRRRLGGVMKGAPEKLGPQGLNNNMNSNNSNNIHNSNTSNSNIHNINTNNRTNNDHYSSRLSTGETLGSGSRNGRVCLSTLSLGPGLHVMCWFAVKFCNVI